MKKDLNAIYIKIKTLPTGKKTMSKLKITGKELRAIGYPEGPVIKPPKSPKGDFGNINN
jgi:hypothetical protein